MSVLVLCPTRSRPAAAREVLRSFQETVADLGSRIVFIVDSDDPLLSEYPAGYVHVLEPTGCMGNALRAATTPPVLGDATSVGMVGDDNRFRTPGWDRMLDGWLTENVGIAYGDDGFQHERLPTSWWLSRRIADEFGMAEPGLRHYYMDNWAKALGEGAKCLRYFPDISIEHLHPLAGKGIDDAIYARGRANETHDVARFEKWRRESMAGDVARLRRLIHADGPRRVLADYHHPALFESLAILFEDRFGWELYRPVGEEWWREKYWRFTNLGMKLNWTDFLSPEGPYQDAYARAKKGVTLAQAREMDWDYVVASVWENQTGFSRFATEHGAQFVHQIGNASHSVDWSLPAKYMISAKFDAGGKPAVTYHQEFDLRTFRYEPPNGSHQVSNFVLRFDWNKDAYAQFTAAQRMAPEFEWRDYGSLYGDLARQIDVADQMRAAAFIWHDKPISDGFGHAIHNAAAVGRPIVGHARYYQGRLAEPFWRDGETCIDLDRHPTAEAVEIMREVTSDPARHRAMCEAMYETFTQTVDFEDDARRVRELLTT